MTPLNETPNSTPHVSWHIGRLVTAWVFAVVAATSVVLWAPASERFEWIAVTIGATILVSFVLQLGTAQRDGFISRLSYSVVGGAVMIGLVEFIAFIATGR